MSTNALRALDEGGVAAARQHAAEWFLDAQPFLGHLIFGATTHANSPLRRAIQPLRPLGALIHALS